jgi:hypothetical protein
METVYIDQLSIVKARTLATSLLPYRRERLGDLIRKYRIRRISRHFSGIVEPLDSTPGCIDEQGVVRYRHDHLLGLVYRSVEDLRETLAALPAMVG